MEKIIHTSGELFDLMLNSFLQHQMEQAEAETVAIIAELLDCNRLEAQVNRSRVLSGELFQQGKAIIQRRLNNEPWQYIFQRAYFRDLELKVTPSVLIPRPETELLVDFCVEFLPEHGSLLDLGTGSGAIALSVASERPDARVTACDISLDALAIARENAQCIAPQQVEFLHSDLFSQLDGRRFDMIAANLPYVTESEHAGLSPEVRDFEPVLALTSGPDGLDLIRQSIIQAPEHLTPGGSMIWEMSPPQTASVVELIRQDVRYCAVEILNDYTNRNRFVIARLRGLNNF